MLCITHNITNPYFNIASEEYLLRNFDDDIFLIYINEPSIVIGKHQNAYAEINYWFANDNHIKIVRRLSGGGTVFHDQGNLNFCFIRNGKEGNLVDFKKFTSYIIDALHELGVPAELSGRNDLLINGLKISGNAEHVFKKRVLHHGTLLFSSKLDHLREALKVNISQYQDKAVKSIRSKVTNIDTYLDKPMTMDEFKNSIFKLVAKANPNSVDYQFSDDELMSIKELIKDKYDQWDWNYGYSPHFVAEKEFVIDNDNFYAKLEVDKGFIKTVDIRKNGNDLPNLASLLIDSPYNDLYLSYRLIGNEENVNPDDLVRKLF